MLGILLLANGLTSDRLAGSVHWHEVVSGQSLTSIGARFGVESSTLAADNGLRINARLTPGQHLVIDNRHIVPAVAVDGVVINVPQRMLFVLRDGRVLGSFPVAVGRPSWPTPTGQFEIRVKETDPTWDVPASIQREMAAAGKEVLCKVPPGPRNPLGTRWLGLSSSSIGIHGTNTPASIYQFTTHGCIRLHQDDVARLFALVEIGTPVQIIYEPVLVARVSPQEVLVEVHRDVYKRGGATTADVSRALAQAGTAGLVEDRDVERIAGGHSGRATLLRLK
jgi:L,D-transpeptidase ErfK/SrfK